ncbi:MAG: hypothetical protein JKY55_09790 [Aliivibrio sp.]|uniref:hypothetical protein n=1 Tax=Aliivibrio sp. TaxID=1872443 RepID=UPI001A60F962|nr:hypothetical protein [Aliivibrio sp.]
MIAIILSLMLSAQDTRPFDYKPAIGCKMVQAPKGWEIECPPVRDEERRAYMLKRKAPKLPGHASDAKRKEPIEPPVKEEIRSYVLEDYPSRCRPARIKFSDRSGQFIAFLRRERNSSAANSLTNEAAYSVEQLIRSYITAIDREAVAKFRYSKRGGDGDAICTAHFEFGTAEIKHIGQLIIDELNKGNQDLTGTGLNPYAYETNR